jgi:hypothetical protein
LVIRQKLKVNFVSQLKKIFYLPKKRLILCFSSDKTDSTIYKNKETQCHKSLILALAQR